jgi:hypothetical protein
MFLALAKPGEQEPPPLLPGIDFPGGGEGEGEGGGRITCISARR